MFHIKETSASIIIIYIYIIKLYNLKYEDTKQIII